MSNAFTVPLLWEQFIAGNLVGFKETLRPFKRHNHQGNYSNLPSSLSRSPRWESSSTHAPASVINRRDGLGRTALHLAASSLDPKALEYVQLLLESPNVNINLQDLESGWTALHRALYAGNLVAARLLVGHNNCDMTVKDHEGSFGALAGQGGH
jgi:ankyrin repeat protein